MTELVVPIVVFKWGLPVMRLHHYGFPQEIPEVIMCVDADYLKITNLEFPYISQAFLSNELCSVTKLLFVLS